MNDELCESCGTKLLPGPMGPQCMQCLFSLGTAEDAFEGVAEFFPELSIQEKVARGGFGTVFRAQQRRMKRQVALKFLDSVLAQSTEAVALFEKEMVTVGGLDHPGIVRAHDAGERDGHWYMVMEFVDGADCGALVRKHGKLPIAESCEIIRQAALALHYAHSKGLVHRDVKPGNLMIAGGALVTGLTQVTGDTSLVTQVKVLDFGLASLAVAPILSNPSAIEDDSSGDRFLGTLEYVAPEQIEAPAQVDARADIYALGATLRRFLTGKPAREGASEQTLMLRMKTIVSTPVPPISTLRPDLPPALAALCDRLVALSRDARPATAAEVAALLAPWCAGAELARLFTDGPLAEKAFVFPKKNRRPLWLAAAALVAIGAFLARPTVPTAPTAPPLEGSAVFSEKVARFHDIPPQNMPRLLSAEWEIESEHLATEAFKGLLQARLRPDARLMWIHEKELLITQPRAGGKWEIGKRLPGLHRFDVQPETGNIVWTHTTHPDDLVLHRTLADGTQLPPLAPDFSSEASAEARAVTKAQRLARGDQKGCAYPWGMAFVTESTLPPGPGLRPGDVLYADEGHRPLALYDRPVYPKVETSPGLWKFRFDSDAPAQRLGSLPPFTLDNDNSYFPLDVTVSRHGVFLLNRSYLTASGKAKPSDFNARVLRWEPRGFRPCTTDQPILSPAGIAADPLSADLFVLDGGTIVQPGVVEQRILRLRPAGPDRYTVEPFARKFRGFSYNGIQITPDGQRMVITDEKLSAVVVLRRK